MIGKTVTFNTVLWSVTGAAWAGKDVYLLWLKRGDIEQRITGKRKLKKVLRSVK